MIKITLQKTLSALIICGFIITSQTALAADPCESANTYDLVECVSKGLESAKKQTQQAINAQKNKIPNNRFGDLQQSQKAWEAATEAYCDYNTKNGGSEDRIHYGFCITEDWKKRAKNVKADAKAFKSNPTLSAEQQEKAKNSYLSEEQKLDKKVQNILKQIDKDYPEDMVNIRSGGYFRSEKKYAYQKHISAWKDFAISYCSYQGNEFVCLNSLYKAKNKLVQKDYDWFFKRGE